MAESLVIIPTYNERENVADIIQAVFSLPEEFHILIVDDNSPDGTAAIVQEMMTRFNDKLFLLERPGKQGLGTAYISGFKWGLEQNYDILYEMDADFSHPPKDLLRLRKVLLSGIADVAVGSRYVKGGGVKDWPMDRRILSYGASLYVRMITWMPIKDPTAGFIGYRAEVLRKIDLNTICFQGYAFQIEMKYAARSLGFRIIEIPIIFRDRQKGASKLSTHIIHEAIQGVWTMKVKSMYDNYRKVRKKKGASTQV